MNDTEDPGHNVPYVRSVSMVMTSLKTHTHTHTERCAISWKNWIFLLFDATKCLYIYKKCAINHISTMITISACLDYLSIIICDICDTSKHESRLHFFRRIFVIYYEFHCFSSRETLLKVLPVFITVFFF